MPQELKKTVPRPKPKAPSQKIIERAIDEAVQEIGYTKFTCYLCGELKPSEQFYSCTDPLCKTGVTRICKKCAEKIVYNIGPDGKKKAPTEESVKLALEYLDKPFYEKVYESSLDECSNKATGRIKKDVWTSYIKNISMIQYRTDRWRDGDGTAKDYIPEEVPISNAEEVKKMYEVNRRTVISALGYDPFETASELDKPLMYNKLVGFLDESTQDDELKLGACVEIVHSLNQSEKINSVINSLQRTPNDIIRNSSTIKSLEATKKDIMKTALDLARDNGISIKHSNRNTKGAHTLTGKLKQLKESDLRSKEMNEFDIRTSAGMRQVADISYEAIFKQLSFDENDYTNMISTQKSMIKELQEKLEAVEEECRLYRRERNDLRELCEDHNLINEEGELVYGS